MRRDIYLLDVPTTVAIGVALRVADFQNKWIQAAGMGGTVVLEGSINGVDWVQLIASVVNGLAELPQGVILLRANRTVGGAGTVHLAAFGRSAE